MGLLLLLCRRGQGHLRNLRMQIAPSATTTATPPHTFFSSRSLLFVRAKRDIHSRASSLFQLRIPGMEGWPACFGLEAGPFPQSSSMRFLT